MELELITDEFIKTNHIFYLFGCILIRYKKKEKKKFIYWIEYKVNEDRYWLYSYQPFLNEDGTYEYKYRGVWTKNHLYQSLNILERMFSRVKFIYYKNKSIDGKFYKNEDMIELLEKLNDNLKKEKEEDFDYE